MTNLWKETIRVLEEHGKTFENIEYIQGTDFGITKENFEKVAKKSNYNSGFGSPKVAEDLVVVGTIGGLNVTIMMEVNGGSIRKNQNKLAKLKKLAILLMACG